MSKQIELFNEVRKRYPDYTYKKLSALFEIQQTRLFRLMTGACDLKASEYFIIKEKLESNSSEIGELIQFLEKHSFGLSRNDCIEFKSEIENKLFLRKLIGA
ncbi:MULTISPECIES: hypothetical protein [Halobacteriovorax]|uniref:Uncharacterized protein n=1 Tax=Halobacteriovorax vibrionivorans TaxID=2152716 RepID=A0ABY0IGL8_9BACT|nr:MULTISPECIES: hypothetical protein [Halobacteriovorax]AYF43336.1 hypothetical protein BALOs_0321 [Halobacteriovorax sp. BALOs_7]RZF22090.1 hypothetical protein DAY19_10435 [Halobacteriovorax vibrionivorans]TGD46949.1 hypothetical protein EP118_09970 [Halobacteriovorax sp. Y22]